MTDINQNKKVMISALSVFAISFSMMLFLLGKGDVNNIKSDVLGSGHSTSNEASQSHEEEKQDSLLNQKEISFLTTSEGYIVEATDLFCEHLDVKCTSLENVKIFDLVHKDEVSDLAADYTKLVQGDEEVKGIGPYKIAFKNSKKLFLFDATPVQEKDKTTSVIFVVKDITEKAEGYIDDQNSKNSAEDSGWVKSVYPPIKDLKDDKTKQLLVDKISFNAKK
ncbi:MAG: hypothetical protein AAB373_00555 [Patescibacteria group bacterium]